MKLGEMQRYTAEVEQISPKPIIYHKFDNDGLWCLFSDAQAKSLADERRIEELEAALTMAYENLNGWCDAIDHNGTGWDDWDKWFKEAYYGVSEARYSDGSGHDAKPSVLSILRAALRVETQHE